MIREVVKATGDIITVAGNGTAGYSGDNGPATAAELDSPRGVAVDSAGDLFIADNGNNVVREVVKATGDIITVAGNGTAGYSGDNGPATAAELNGPNGVAVDSAGDLFIADTDNNAVREVVKATGDIITVAGNGTAGYSGDDGPATAAELDNPIGVAVDSAGDLFIADSGNNVVREVVKATGDIITVAGNGTAGYSGDNGPATAAELDGPGRVAVDSAGDLFIADTGNNVVREVTPAVTVTIGPGGPIGGTAPTRTVLTAQPRPANLGRPVTLTATVKDLKHRGPTPIGSVTFLDGTAILGTVALRHGKASLKTSSLPLGPNTIQAYYIPGQGFAPSTAAVVENVRAHRSRSKAAPAAETGESAAVPSTSMAIRVGGVAAIPVGAVTIVGATHRAWTDRARPGKGGTQRRHPRGNSSHPDGARRNSTMASSAGRSGGSRPPTNRSRRRRMPRGCGRDPMLPYSQ